MAWELVRRAFLHCAIATSQEVVFATAARVVWEYVGVHVQHILLASSYFNLPLLGFGPEPPPLTVNPVRALLGYVELHGLRFIFLSATIRAGTAVLLGLDISLGRRFPARGSY